MTRRLDKLQRFTVHLQALSESLTRDIGEPLTPEILADVSFFKSVCTIIDKTLQGDLLGRTRLQYWVRDLNFAIAAHERYTGEPFDRAHLSHPETFALLFDAVCLLRRGLAPVCPTVNAVACHWGELPRSNN